MMRAKFWEIGSGLALAGLLLVTTTAFASMRIEKGQLNDSLRVVLEEYGELDAVKAKVRQGANVNLRGDDGTTPLLMAT